MGVLEGGAGGFEGLLEEEKRGGIGKRGAGGAKVFTGDSGVGGEGF